MEQKPKDYMMLIDGQWVESSGNERTEVINPFDKSIVGTIPRAKKDDIDQAAEVASNAFEKGTWSRITPGERSTVLLKIAQMLNEKKDEFSKVESVNSGKSIKQTSNYDLPYSIDNINFIAGASRILEGKAMGEYSNDGTSAVRREPIGTVGVITPWNYPLMMAIWRAFPALAVGNSVVIKPASYTPLTTIMLGEIMIKAGIPRGVLNIVTGPGGEIGEALATNKNIDMIAFTGSEEVGKRLSKLSSDTLKKVSLELGGKAPFIVFDDANIDAAVQGAVVGGLVNNGQDCANSTRYYLHESIKKEFINKLLDKLNRVKIGNPLDLDTDMGPLVSESHRQRVEDFIQRGQEEGGELIYGGKRPSKNELLKGNFLEPTVIVTDNENSSIVKEEIFGPVFTVLGFTNYDDVIKRSNDVIYGLGSSVWTKDVRKAIRATRDLRFGTVWVNEHVTVPSEMPWAGYKKSGHGASLSQYSLEEFTYVKHVYIDISGEIRKSWYSQVFSDASK